MFIITNEDVEHLIFSYLNAKDLCRASQVNKEWKIHSTHKNLWKNFFPKIKIASNLALKQHFNTRGIVSFNGVILRIENFLNEIQSNRSGEFICYFPEKTHCYIALKVFKSRPRQFDVTESYWFMQTYPFKKQTIDMFTLSKSGKRFFLHVRLPVDLADTISQITQLVKNHENLKILQLTS